MVLQSKEEEIWRFAALHLGHSRQSKWPVMSHLNSKVILKADLPVTNYEVAQLICPNVCSLDYPLSSVSACLCIISHAYV
jgi:hypothetical protein